MDVLENLTAQYNHLKKVYQRKVEENIREEEQSILVTRLNGMKKNIEFLQKNTISNITKDFPLLSYIDKKSLLEEILKTKTPYRKQLGAGKKVGFGIEIEVTNILLQDLRNLIYGEIKRENLILPYDVQKEDTVCNFFGNERKKYRGGEVVTPILHDQEKIWKDLKKLFSILRNNDLKITEKCGMHIHIGSEAIDYNEKKLKELIKIFILYEHVLFRFFLGDFFKVRELTFARPLREDWIEKIEWLENRSIKQIKEEFGRNVSINILNFSPLKYYQKNTIEIRMPNGTLNELVAQNGITTMLYLLKKIKEDDTLGLYLKDKLKKEKTRAIYYTDIALEDAFEFCDLIFSNTTDKIYFLKQYLNQLKRVPPSRFYPPTSGHFKEMVLK